MLICRRALLRIAFPKVPHSPAVGSLSRGLDTASKVAYAAITSIHPHRTYASLEHEEDDAAVLQSTEEGESHLFRDLKIRFPRRRRDVDEREAAAAGVDLDFYESVRLRGEAAAQQLTTAKLRRIAWLATEHRSITVANHLAADLVKFFAERPLSDLRTIADLLLRLPDPLIRPDRTMTLLSLFEPNPSEPSLDKKLFQKMIHAILAHLDTNLAELSTVAEYLIVRLRRNVAPSGVRSMIHRPPWIVQESFRLTRRFVEFTANERAMQVFQELVNTRNVPPEAINAVQGDPSDFRLTILTVLTKAALHWGWREEAIVATIALLQSRHSDQPKCFTLAVDVLRDTLDESSRSDLGHCRRLMCELDSRAAGEFTIPDEIIRLFYDMAHRLDMGGEAELFYAYTRSDATDYPGRTDYPPPFGKALLWLLQQLTEKSRNRHLGRQLVNQVLKRHDLIPVQDRANFIAVTASHGYATQARALWTKYSMERYREMIVGSSVTMLRMTELFSHLITNTYTKLDRLLDSSRDTSGVGRAARPAGYFTLKRLPSESESQGSDEFEEATEDESIPHRPKPEVYTKLIDDFKMFSQCVIEEFQRAHRPLAKARHYDLNALARAYFMVGNIQAGFDVIKILLDRREIPNLRDINVALGAMAAYDVRNAARMIDKMVVRGLKPDEVTIGTVLYYAMQAKDVALAASLVRKANLYFGGLSLKSLSSLIRLSVTRDGRPSAALRSNLAEALRIMRSLRDRRYVCTPEMGKYCIFASLSVDDAVMAFEYWMMLVKDRTEWRDDEQAFQRRLIADQIRKRRQKGSLNYDYSAWMLSQLREPLEQGTVEK
jgi:hypothetical protein